MRSDRATNATDSMNGETTMKDPHFLRIMLAEHRCLVSHAREIDGLLGELNADGGVDYVALLDRLALLRERFETAHAPRDHLLLRHLLDDLGVASGQVLITSLEIDAARFSEQLGVFAAAVQGVLFDTVVSRDALVRVGRAATHSLRAQIALEESAILPWARTRFDADSWRQLDHDLDVMTGYRSTGICAASRAAERLAHTTNHGALR